MSPEKLVTVPLTGKKENTALAPIDPEYKFLRMVQFLSLLWFLMRVLSPCMARDAQVTGCGDWLTV